MRDRGRETGCLASTPCCVLRENLFKREADGPCTPDLTPSLFDTSDLGCALALSPPCHSAMVGALTALTVSQRVPSRMQLCRPRALPLFHICLMASGFSSLLFPYFPFPQHPDSCLRGLFGDQSKNGVDQGCHAPPIMAVNNGKHLFVPHW